MRSRGRATCRPPAKRRRAKKGHRQSVMENVNWQRVALKVKVVIPSRGEQASSPAKVKTKPRFRKPLLKSEPSFGTDAAVRTAAM